MSDNRGQMAPPQDLAAERGVVGGLLVHGRDLVAQVSMILSPDDFFDVRHRLVYLAEVMLWDRGEPVDEITVMGYLAEQGNLTVVGGAAFLAQLSDVILSPAHVEHYARVVRGKARLRQMVAAARKVVEIASHAHDADEALAEGQRIINQAAQGGQMGGIQATADLLPRVYAAYEERRQSGGKDFRAIPTGWPALDACLGGLRPGKLIMPAGRPGMGKTSWMLGLAANVALRQGRTVLFATKEQPPTEMVDWLICAEGQINTQHWAAGRTDSAEHFSADNRRRELESAPLWWLQVRERGDRALRSIASHAAYLKAQRGLALVLADYIQIMSQTRTKHEDISEISSGLKALAMDLDIPVVAAAQLSRKVEERDDKRPCMADLKGSGSLEEDADVVLLFYRPAYYDKGSQDKTVQVGVDKHRGGPTGRVDLVFDAPCVRFWDPAASPSHGQPDFF